MDFQIMVTPLIEEKQNINYRRLLELGDYCKERKAKLRKGQLENLHNKFSFFDNCRESLFFTY